MAQPRRGEIWFIRLLTDPPDKGGRPVIVVSIEARNQHERATTVLVVPLSTTLRESPTHIRLLPGETGLREPCEAQAENLTTVRKTSLLPPRQPLRRVGEAKLRELARCVVLALGFLPAQL
jgi:mRNA-degrading endonuclease toxin of MazEF toxin-antitoxin module